MAHGTHRDLKLSQSGTPREVAAERDSGPRTERIDDRLYLTDAAGTRWRVHDVCLGDGRPYHPPRWVRATERVFVSEAGERRWYAFGPHDSWDRDAQTLARQLAAATPKDPRP